MTRGPPATCLGSEVLASRDVSLTRDRLSLPTRPRASPVRRFARKRAAVAIVLRPAEGTVLLVERAARPGDRWSGHMAMPGGLYEPGDRDLVQTAMRETAEEVGIDLSDTPRWGRLDEVTAVEHRRYRPMTITPVVFALDHEPELELGVEVADAFWFPLERAWRGELDGWHWHRRRRLPLPFRCWRYAGHDVWGLTYGMLRKLRSR